MTFLAQAEVSGLAVRMPSGHWRVVDIVPGALLVNTGNLLVHWTNGKYLSTKHRVINTTRSTAIRSRCSSARAATHSSNACRAARARAPARYKPTTYRAMRQWYYGTYD